jgi:hypothetical protein
MGLARVSPLFLTLFLLSIVLTIGCNEVQDRHFANVDEARRERMIERGWVPTITPADAKDIRFQSDLDAGSVYGRFDSSSVAELKSHCSIATDATPVPETGPDWFPDDLRNVRSIGKLKRSGYEVLACDAGHVTVAIQNQGPRVFYWDMPKR